MKIPFQALVDQISDYAIVVLDTEGVVQSWNAGARAITGYTEREAVGRPLSEFLQEDLVAKAMKAGRASMQCWLMRKNGRALWTENVVQMVDAERGGTALGWICQDPFNI
ncbi:MAG TPA: PAS domain-containing protein [Steroidobacteraceae bacterium]|nr:PAS domain-containing protein [Steroidobacteraceae bacterium]